MRARLWLSSFLILGGFLLWASPTWAQTRVQANVCTSTLLLSTNCAWNAATGTGTLLLLVVATDGTASAPTITVAAPWVNVDAVLYPNPGYYPGANAPQVGMWYIANAATRSGNETVTLSVARDTMVTLIEVSGMATAGVVDVDARNGSTATGLTIDSGTTATTTQATEYWLAVGINRNKLNTPGTATGGFTNITPTTGANPGITANATNANAFGYAVADQIVSATGTAHATWPLGTARPWTGIVATFKGCAKPADAGYVAVGAQNGQATVYWSSANPVIVLQKTGTAFSGEAPADGTSYAAGQTGGTLGTATVAYNGTTGDTGVTCTATSCTRTGLTNGTTYYYKVYAKAGSGGASCYAPGTVNTATGVSASPASGASAAEWSYMMAGGSVLKAGIAGVGTIYTSSNASRLISLNTANPSNGAQSWTPQVTTAPIQGWPMWVDVGSGGIKAVQTGTWTVTAPPESVGITTVDPNKSFVVCIERDGNSNASRRTTCELSASSITFNAGEAGTVVQWYVAEFKGGVSVQRGTTTFATTDSTLNVPISAVGLSWSFVLISERTSDTSQTIDEEWTIRARLTSSTNLELSRNTGAANQPVTVAWQVVQMAAATVQRGTATINSGSQNFVTVALSPAVTPGQSFLVMSRRGPASGGIEGQYQVRGEITGGGSTLTFTRTSTTTNAVDIAWEVVSLSDGTSVQRGLITSDLTDNPLNATLSPAIVTAQSLPLITVSGSLSPTDTADLDSTTYTAAFTSTTNLQMQRASNPNLSASVAWQVVQFVTNGGAPVVIGGEQGSGSPLSGRVISVDPTLGITNWELNLRAVTGVDADSFQAPAAAQMRAYSNAAFQSTYQDDVIFVTTRNSSLTPVCGSMTTNNKVFALKASDGSVLWTFNGTCTSNMDYVVGMPAVDYARNRLYVAGHAGGGAQPSLWVIDTLTGSLVQSFALGQLDNSPSPSYDGTTLYVANTTGNLYAINLNTLALKWAAPNYMSLGSAITGFVWEDWALAGYLYFSTADGNVWCVRDPGAGQPPPSAPPASPQAACPWKTLVNASGVSNLLLMTPPYAGLYVGGADGKLHRVNLTTGVDETQFTVGDGTKTVGDPSSETGNEVFVATTEGKIYKILMPLP